MNNKINVIKRAGAANITLSQDASGYYSNLAKQWAVSSSKVQDEDYSAKYYAQQALNAQNEAKNWASKTDGFVADESYSAKYYANKAAEANLEAKDWAVKVDGTVDGTEYSAKYYAQQITSAAGNKADIDFSNISEAAKEVIKENSGSSSGGGSWGSITGTLSDQTDLNTALENRAKADLSNCTCPYVIATGEEGYYWYRKWSDGWLEQGGSSNISAGNKGAVIFPVAYSDSCEYVVSLTGRYEINAGSTNAGLWVYSWQSTMFRWVNNGPDGVIFWYTCGKS